MTKSIRAFLCFVIFGLSIPAAVFAQTGSAGTGVALNQWCTNITTRISTAIARWNNNSAAKEHLYNTVRDRVKTIVDSLQAKGVDTTQLVSALQAYNQAVLKRHTDAQTWVNDLQNTQQYTCGTSQGQFVNAIKAAHQAREVVRTDELQVRNVWQTQLRPAIQAVRGKLTLPTPTRGASM